MSVFKNNNFINQRINIDDSVFEGNTFEDCVLVYGGGGFSFSDNKLNGVTWEFTGPAARTLGMLSAFYRGGAGSKEFVEILLSEFGKEIDEPKSMKKED